MLYNERELIIRSQGGDAEAFGHMYDHYIRVIYTFIYYKTFHKETAEDLASETFFKALKSIHSADPQKPFLSWLYKIAHNTVIDHFRAKRPTGDIDDIWDLADETDIVTDSDVALKIQLIRKELRHLPSADRDIIILRVWQEIPYKDIAKMLGKTEASCKMAYGRALAKLRTALT